MKVLLTGIFTTREDNELVIYNQIKFTMNLLLEKIYGIYFFPIHTPLHLQRAKEMSSRFYSLTSGEFWKSCLSKILSKRKS